MNLLEKFKHAPKYSGVNWAKYKEAFFFLVDEKNYPPLQAVKLIASEEGLSSAEQTKCYNASKSWKRNGGTNE